MEDQEMENVFKKKKLEYANSLNEYTSCTYTQNSFTISTNGNGKMKHVTSSPPLLVEGKTLRTSPDDDDKNNGSPRFHFPHGVNHVSHDRNQYFTDKLGDDSRSTNNGSRERTCASSRFMKSPSDKKWSPEFASVSEQPPLLLKSCSTDHSRTFEKHLREEQRCIPQGSVVNDKYRHPIFATTEDLKTEHVVISNNNWEKQPKPHGLDPRQYNMPCVTSRKNGSYMNTYCNKSMLNKNIYIDCSTDGDVTNGEKDRYKSRTHETSPFRDVRDENVHSLGRQYSREDVNSLLSAGSYKSHSLKSVSSREEEERSPEVPTKGNDNKTIGEKRSLPNRMTIMNFGILEKHEHYIVVFAEINGKRYEGSLSIERKVT